MNSRVFLAVALLLSFAGCDQQEVATQRGGVIQGMRVNALLGGDGAGFERADAPRTFVFPEDHGVHPRYRSEWWYLTAVLEDREGHDYGLQFTLFRQALDAAAEGANPWQLGQVYLAHLAITDVEGEVHRHAERLSRGHPQMAGVTDDQTAFIDDWSLSFDGEALALTARQGDNLQASLRLQATRPPVLQGDAGLSYKGKSQASYYYSWPRLQASGEVMVNGQPATVSGWGWLDREWSTSVLGDHLQGWDWFALTLDDGRDVMAFRLRREDGQRDPYDHGTEVRETQVRTLGVDDFTLEPLAYWQDDSDRRWPTQWQLQLGEETFYLRALLDNQLMQTSIVYWEGIIDVADADGRSLGRGYMELTGY